MLTTQAVSARSAWTAIGPPATRAAAIISPSPTAPSPATADVPRAARIRLAEIAGIPQRPCSQTKSFVIIVPS